MATSNDLGDWYKSIPPITRTWFTGSIIVPLAVALDLVHPGQIALCMDPIIKNFQIWRLVTSVLFYRRSLRYLIQLYFLYEYSSRLETSTFGGRRADYVFCLTFLWLCHIIVGLILSIPILMICMIMSVIYIWCQLNKEVIMSYWFGMQFKAMYLPWVMLVFNWIINGTFREELSGIVIGHLYYFLVFKYPRDFRGVELLRTPNFFYRYFPNERNRFNGGPINRPHRQNDTEDNADNINRDNQVFGGRGHVLGTR